MSDSLPLHGPQNARLLCSPRVCSNCPLSRWCYLTTHPLLLPPSFAFSLSQYQGLLQWVSYSYQVAKILSFSFSISPSNEYSGLISFRMDWLDLLAVQGTRKSLLQHYSLKASILWCSAFFTVQLSHPYMTTRRDVALTIQILLAKWCLYFLICCLGSS